MSNEKQEKPKERWHRRVVEARLGTFALLTTVVISIGGIVEITPMFTAKLGPQPLAGVKPFTALELAGRDIYIREGCYVCHSQMIRPMRSELLRFGEWSRAGEYAYEHPFLLGSRRIGPDLMRVGGKYPDAWHFEHMRDPRSTSPGSIMPVYTWLHRNRVDPADVQASLRAMARVGVPYTPADVAGAPAEMKQQGDSIVRNLASMGIRTEPDREIVALIAYLQRLGKDGKAAIAAQSAAGPHAGATSPLPGRPEADAATRGHGDRANRAAETVTASPHRRVAVSAGKGVTP
jgi:cytochrome c oxidase cbb3-type subunit I/II